MRCESAAMTCAIAVVTVPTAPTRNDLRLDDLSASATPISWIASRMTSFARWVVSSAVFASAGASTTGFAATLVSRGALGFFGTGSRFPPLMLALSAAR
jgi:hypothetical protein